MQHEQNAAHMADGYSRISGKHGVCTAQNGPGISNFVTGNRLQHYSDTDQVFQLEAFNSPIGLISWAISQIWIYGQAFCMHITQWHIWHETSTNPAFTYFHRSQGWLRRTGPTLPWWWWPQRPGHSQKGTVVSRRSTSSHSSRWNSMRKFILWNSNYHCDFNKIFTVIKYQCLQLKITLFRLSGVKFFSGHFRNQILTLC